MNTVFHRSPAGASGRCDCPNRCDGTGCVLLSAAMCTHSTRAGRDSRLVRNGGSDEEAQAGQAAWPLHLLLSLDHRRRRRDLTRVDAGFAFPINRGVAPCAMQGDETPLRLSPLSGGPSTCGQTGESAPQAERHERRMGHPSAAALTSSAMTADPRRADPGNLLAGAVAARLRPYYWPVALRGGGHIAGAL